MAWNYILIILIDKNSPDMTTFEFNYKLLDLRDHLFNFAYSLTNNQEDAEDLVQETYYKAIKSKDQFEDNTNLKAWTHTIMKNTFINNYRRSARINARYSYNSDFYLIVDYYNTSYSDTQYEEKEIKKEINRLDDKFKVPFLLHVKGYSYQEIAQKEKLKLGTVKNRIFCARQRLIRELKDYC